MKLKNYILSICLLLLISNAKAQEKDSITIIRKPVLVFLLEQVEVAKFHKSQYELLKQRFDEVLNQAGLLEEHIEIQKVDIIRCEELVFLERSGADSWKALYEQEQRDHNRTRKKYRLKSTLFSIVTIPLAIVVGVVVLISD